MSRLEQFPIFRRYNLLRIPPVPEELEYRIYKALTFVKVNPNAKEDEPKVEHIPTFMHVPFDDERHLVVGAGALHLIEPIFKSAGYRIVLIDVDPGVRYSRFRCAVDPDDILTHKPRDWQIEAFKLVVNNERGLLQVPTGIGKTEFIKQCCQLFPHAKILYTTYGKGLLQDVFRRIGSGCPNVTRVGGNGDKEDARIVCCTIGCLHHLNDTYDIVFVDECDEVATLPRVQQLLGTQGRKYFGLTANDRDRMDESDKWNDVLFGPRHVLSTYEQGVKAGNIVPIEVRWRHCDWDMSNIEIGDRTKRDRALIWRNYSRNCMLIEDALRHSQNGEQTLITVRTIEHALVLRSGMTGCAIAYAGKFGKAERRNWEKFRRWGLVGKTEERLSTAALDDQKSKFSRGEIKLAVCNSVWFRGVDFTHLIALVRGDAAGTKQPNIQITGRLSRVNRAIGKTKGIMYDYDDSFHPDTRGRARVRQAVYTREKFQQIFKWQPPQ